jgi:hypothetical protein
MDKRSKALLEWSTAHHGQNEQEMARPPASFDPQLVELVLGKSDAKRMQESAKVAYSSGSCEERWNALDELEFLLESMDNANDLKPLGLWPVLVKGLDTDNIKPLSSREGETLRQKTASIIGTALQNNEKAQNEFISSDGIKILLGALVVSSNSAGEICKLIYALSAAIQHQQLAWKEFVSNNGVSIMLELLQNSASSDAVAMRALSFIRRTIEQFDTAVWKNQVLHDLINRPPFSNTDDEYIMECILFINNI